MAGKCGHVNKHSYDYQGNLDDLKCALDKDHGGEHSAMHFERGTQFSSEAQDLKYKRACKKCKKFVSGEKSYCQECFEPFPENTPYYYEGEIEVFWKDAAGTPVSEIVPNSPGIEVLNADYMFPEKQQQKQQEMEQRSVELADKLKVLEERIEGKLNELEEVSEEAPPEVSPDDGDKGEN